MRRALIVVGKAPLAGSAKTRLVPPLTAREAADLYRGFLLDTLELADRLGWERTSLVHPRGDGPSLRAVLGSSRVNLLEQHGAGLGDALGYAFAHHFANGFDTAILIGSDNPTLPATPVQAACEHLLAGADLTIGPSLDGGYYLIGMRQPHLGVFTDIEWSSPRVYRQTLERARQLRLDVQPVDEWYDVDEAGDLERLAGEIAAAPGHVAQHTRQVLAGLSTWAPAASASPRSAQHTRA